MKALDKLKSLNPFKKTVKEETKETAKGPGLGTYIPMTSIVARKRK